MLPFFLHPTATVNSPPAPCWHGCVGDSSVSFIVSCVLCSIRPASLRKAYRLHVFASDVTQPRRRSSTLAPLMLLHNLCVGAVLQVAIPCLSVSRYALKLPRNRVTLRVPRCPCIFALCRYVVTPYDGHCPCCACALGVSFDGALCSVLSEVCLLSKTLAIGTSYRLVGQTFEVGAIALPSCRFDLRHVNRTRC